MSRRLLWLAPARRNLVSIFQYVSRQSGSVAAGQRFVARLRARCETLAQAPATLGRPRPEFGEELRSVAFGNHVIFFRYGDGSVAIINIIEGHRDIGALFPSKPDES